MLLKKLWLSGVCIASGALFGLDGFKNPLSSGIDRLDQIEMRILNNLGNQKEVTRTYASFDEKTMNRLMNKGMTIFGKISNKYGMIPETSGQAIACIKEICSIIERDPELTVLVKGFVKVIADAFIDFISSGNFEKLVSDDMTDKELVHLINQYMPQEKNLVEAFAKYLVLDHEFCKQQILQNGSLSIDDVSYRTKQFADVCKLPKKSHQFWVSLVVAMDKGMKALPSKISSHILMRATKQVIQNEQNKLIESLKSVIVMRKNIVQKATNRSPISEKEFNEYEKMLSKFFNILADAREFDNFDYSGLIFVK